MDDKPSDLTSLDDKPSDLTSLENWNFRFYNYILQT